MKKSSMLIVLLMVFGAGLNAQTNLERGDIAYKARHYKQAISHYERATLDNPGNVALLENLAHCYRFINNMPSSAKKYQQVCLNPASNPLNFYFYGTVLKANKDYDKARILFGKYATANSTVAAQAQASCDFAKTNLKTESAFFVSKEGVSSAIYDDYAPILHPNNGLVFTSSRKIKYQSGGVSNPAAQNFLFESTRGADGQLTGLKIVKNNTGGIPASNLSPIAIINNESKGVSTYNEFADGLRHIRTASLEKLSMEIHNSMVKIEDFVPGEEFPYVGERSASFPAFANNGMTIYFAADGYPGGQGGWDIWVMHYQNNRWTSPQNLGPNVNTAGDEICPHIANNGQLFFASDFHKGFGGYDVFRAQKINNVWKDVRNLGNQVNSSFDDMYFVFDSNTRTGYFSSNRNGRYNIYNGLMKGNEALMPLVNSNEVNVAVNTPANNTPTNNNNNNTANNNTTNPNNNNNYNNNTANNNTTNPNNNTVANNNNGNVTRTNNGGYRPTSNNNTTNPNNNNNYNNNTANNNTTNPVKTNPTPTVSDKPTVTSGNTVPCAMNFYIGGIIDASTNRPLAGALVYIKNLKTGIEKKIKDPTNHYGEYSVILDPLSDYTIAISKSGFKNLVFDVNTGTGGKKTLLGTRTMSSSPMLERDKYGNIIQPNGPIVNTTPTEDELVNPPKSSNKNFSLESNGTRVPKTGYLIQAIVATKLTPEEKLELGKYGNIFTEARGNKTAYRIGVFVDMQHLDKSLAEIKETYRDAFRVAVELDNNHLGGRIALSSQVIYPLPAKEPLPVLEDNTPAVVDQPVTTKEKEHNTWANNDIKETTTPRGTTTETVEKTAEVAFKVQLGAYKDAEKISFSHISHLGMIEKKKQANGLTYFYISSFKTLPEARVARTKAQESGVPSPFIVAFKNGVRVKISDVVN